VRQKRSEGAADGEGGEMSGRPKKKPKQSKTPNIEMAERAAGDALQWVEQTQFKSEHDGNIPKILRKLIGSPIRVPDPKAADGYLEWTPGYTRFTDHGRLAEREFLAKAAKKMVLGETIGTPRQGIFVAEFLFRRACEWKRAKRGPDELGNYFRDRKIALAVWAALKDSGLREYRHPASHKRNATGCSIVRDIWEKKYKKALDCSTIETIWKKHKKKMPKETNQTIEEVWKLLNIS
jgi:hypothetical protein